MLLSSLRLEQEQIARMVKCGSKVVLCPRFTCGNYLRICILKHLIEKGTNYIKPWDEEEKRRSKNPSYRLEDDV